MLRRLAGNKRFEVESPGEPIQIMGLLEAAGSRFDHLWIAGMNDEVWPARPAPNPFIPLALQRQFNLPHASPARELAFATRTSQRLLQSADEVVVSYAKADAERELAPSPLFAMLPRHLTIEVIPVTALVDEVPFETLDDAAAPAMDTPVSDKGPGGTLASRPSRGVTDPPPHIGIASQGTLPSENLPMLMAHGARRGIAAWAVVVLVLGALIAGFLLGLATARLH